MRCAVLSLLVAAAWSLTACSPAPVSPAADVTTSVATASNAGALKEPPNVGDAKTVATQYHDSGAYDADLTAATASAVPWIVTTAPKATKPAVVFDIDDTALSNWTVIKADDFGRVIDGPCDTLPQGPCGWRAWDLTSQSTTIAQTQAVYNAALQANCAVFFITGRDESQRAATVTNLQKTGYGTYAGLVMPATGATYASAADFKAPQRAQIEAQGYTIIANLGDQPSDLAGGHAQKTWLLPNPFYRIP